MLSDPIFWLGLSVGLVAAGIFAVVITLLPAVIELGKAARSVDRFFDTLLRELPPTLEALRLTSLEVSEIADSVDEGVKSAGQVVKTVNRSLDTAKTQAASTQITVRSVWAGARAAWKTFALSPSTTLPAHRDPLLPPPDSDPLSPADPISSSAKTR